MARARMPGPRRPRGGAARPRPAPCRVTRGAPCDRGSAWRAPTSADGRRVAGGGWGCCPVVVGIRLPRWALARPTCPPPGKRLVRPWARARRAPDGAPALAPAGTGSAVRLRFDVGPGRWHRLLLGPPASALVPGVRRSTHVRDRARRVARPGSPGLPLREPVPLGPGPLAFRPPSPAARCPRRVHLLLCGGGARRGGLQRRRRQRRRRWRAPEPAPPSVRGPSPSIGRCC